MVKHRVLPGSVIWTDEGNSFVDLVDLEGYHYSHATVCHAGVIDKRNAVLRRYVFSVVILLITVFLVDLSIPKPVHAQT